MSYLLKVIHPTNVQIKKNGLVKSKQLLPSTKYVINDLKSNQIVDLKQVKHIIIKAASSKEESCFEHIDLV